jgi:hypothetical protein
MQHGGSRTLQSNETDTARRHSHELAACAPAGTRGELSTPPLAGWARVRQSRSHSAGPSYSSHPTRHSHTRSCTAESENLFSQILCSGSRLRSGGLQRHLQSTNRLVCLYPDQKMSVHTHVCTDTSSPTSKSPRLTRPYSVRRRLLSRFNGKMEEKQKGGSTITKKRRP